MTGNCSLENGFVDKGLLGAFFNKKGVWLLLKRDTSIKIKVTVIIVL